MDDPESTYKHIVWAKYGVAIALVLGAAMVAATGHDGWGWFLFCVVLIVA